MASFNLNPNLPVVPPTPDLAAAFTGHLGQPVVLFPVRLETRFFPRPDLTAELRVRVYPDKVHIDTHETGLTEQELTWGKHFWEQTWRAGKGEKNEAGRKLAWQQLAERFDARRAAWVAHALRPLNPNDRPDAAAETLPKPIVFPTRQPKPDDWTRAPLAAAMPSAWHVLAYADNRLVAKATGNPVRQNLATGPDPSQPPPLPSDETLAIDEGMKWMVDFDEAEKAGMGIRLVLPAAQAQKGVDFLLVLGVKTPPEGVAPDPKPLADLFDAHHYTDGLSFVPYGTPSNNTPDAPSGFSTADPGFDESYQAERAAAAFKSGDRSNADALSHALGLRDAHGHVFANLANANAAEQLDARHMNRALWPATFGYFLTQMLVAGFGEQQPIPHETVDLARRHFVDYVRANGPLPALRVGRQPYGVLPVTSLNFWKPKAGQETASAFDVALKDVLLKLRELWRNNLSEVPRVGRGANPDQDMAEIFSMDGISSGYSVRHLLGEDYLQKLWEMHGPPDRFAWWGKQLKLTSPLINVFDLNWTPRLARATYSGWEVKLKGPLAQAETPSENAPLAPAYIGLLLSAPTLDHIRNENFPEPKPKSLLFSLLRHALLLEYRSAAHQIRHQGTKGLGFVLSSRDNELVGFGVPTLVFGGTGHLSIWEVLNQPVLGVTGEPLGGFLHGLRVTPTDPKVAPHVAGLLEMRESMKWLETVSAARLERLCAGTLDLCAHRLDAWITSFATKRLEEMRAANRTGVLLGGYGWVMNLTPAPARTPEVAPPGESGQVFSLPDNPGYTHTPSLAHASAVAVLRSGHLTYSDPATKDLLAINLSSERVRLASWLLDGVRQGQPLGALLGYRFERRLRDAKLAHFIRYFREVAPLVANKQAETKPAESVAVEAVAAGNVADGLALQRRWLAARSSPTPPHGPLSTLLRGVKKQPDPAQLAQARAALEAELTLLDDAVDAVSDTLLAESVYQAVEGNPLRTAGTLDAVAGGAPPPPELEMVRTPRTGAALTYRLVTLFSGAPALPAEWRQPAQPHRANAEPHLNAWAAKLLGNPAKVRCVVERFDPSNGAALETKELRLAELRLTPLDLVYAVQGARDTRLAEIEQRIVYALKHKDGGFAPDAPLRLNPARGANWPVDELSFGEFAEVVRAVRVLVSGVRALDANDLNLPERAQPSAADLTELNTRANAAERVLLRVSTDLQPWLKPAAATLEDLEPLRDALVRASHLGVPAAVPVSAAGLSGRDALLLQAAAVAKEVARRLEQLGNTKKSFNPQTATPDDTRTLHVKRLQAVFGDSFVVLPRFAAGNAAELSAALADSARVQDNDPLASVNWFLRAARVREGAARLDAVLTHADALGAGERLDLSVAQLPHTPGDRWVGLPMQASRPLSASRFSLVVQSSKLDVKQPLAGLLIDEWVEVVPSASETTGMVLQFDQPDAAPPQSILLAVPPDLEQPWTLWSLQQVVLETLDLARLRAVDTDALDEVGHYLPALYFAVNNAGQTVSTDFANLK